MRWWGMTLAVLAACAAVEEPGDEDGGGGGARGAPDALVGRVGGRGGGGPAPKPGPGPAPEPDAAAGCSPGTRLGLCTVCGFDGRPEAAESDAACPPVDCAGLDRLELREDEEGAVCLRVVHRAAPGTCAGPGRCAEDPGVVCRPVEPTEVARATGPCQRIVGCEPGGTPTVVNATPGTACNGPGACRDDGTCSVSAECATFDGRSCQEGVHGDGTPFCELYVHAGGDRTSCDDYCRRHGSRCLAAWGDRDDTCQHGDGSDCNDDHRDLICRCARPDPE